MSFSVDPVKKHQSRYWVQQHEDKGYIGFHVQCISVVFRNMMFYTSRNILSVSKHFRDIHGGNIADLQVISIEKVWKPRRSGDRHKRVLVRKAYWILKRNTCFPLGLHFRTDPMHHKGLVCIRNLN